MAAALTPLTSSLVVTSNMLAKDVCGTAAIGIRAVEKEEGVEEAQRNEDAKELEARRQSGKADDVKAVLATNCKAGGRRSRQALARKMA